MIILVTNMVFLMINKTAVIPLNWKAFGYGSNVTDLKKFKTHTERDME